METRPTTDVRVCSAHARRDRLRLVACVLHLDAKLGHGTGVLDDVRDDARRVIVFRAADRQSDFVSDWSDDVSRVSRHGHAAARAVA